MTNEAIYRKRITFLAMASLAPLLAATPFIIGIIGASLTPNCNEANCGWGVLPWFTFFTVPAGFVFFVFALIRFLASLRTRLNKNEVAIPTEQKIRRYYFAWMATASGPLVLAIVLVLSLFAGPVGICDVNDVCTKTANGYFVDALLIIAPTLIGLSWLYLLAVAIWNRVKK